MSNANPDGFNRDAIGELEATFTVSVVFKAACWIGGAAALSVGVTLLLLYKLNPALGIELYYAVTIGGVCAAAGITILVAVIFFSNLSYEVYSNAVVRNQGSRREVIDYSTVRTYRDTVNGIEFGLADGRSTFWSLGPIRDPFGFRDVVREKVCERMWPAVCERFQQGELIDFDQLAMDRTKIVYNGKSLPWSEVAEIFVFIQRGACTLYIKQPGAFFAFCKVPIGPRGGVMNHFLIEKLIALTRPDLLIQRSDSEIPD